MTTATTERRVLLARSQRLAVFTIAWNLVEGVVAIAAALIASSRALIGFGLDSAIESISATVLLWRLSAEMRDPARAERVEQRATKAIGISFLLLAAFVAADSIRSLIGHHEPDASPVGIVLTAISLVVMPLLATRKRHVAIALGSRAAQADSNQTWACATLSAVVLAGLALNAALGWWWSDPVAALGVAVLLIHEGRETLTADHVDDCC
jgi:divalent metal cation (Fe/Co/Zn/Cd) transporter